MSKVYGYVELDSAIVIAACDMWLTKREEIKAKKKKAAIEHEMNKTLFPAKTEAEALQRLIDPFGGYDWEITGSLWQERIEEIKLQASLAEKIFLSTDITSSIGKYMVK